MLLSYSLCISGLLILERVVVDAAAIATVIAVWFAYRALRDSENTGKALSESLDIARIEREENTRARAALVLQHADLLAARLQSIWNEGLAYDVYHPSEETIDYYLREVEQDVKWADDLLDRASRVDPELTAYAELVSRKAMGIRLSLRLARKTALSAQANLLSGQEERQKHKWEPYRIRIMQHAAQAIELLRRIESCFPQAAVTIKGRDRQNFLKDIGEEVERTAKPKVEALRREVEHPDSKEGQ